ncbi:carboxypeptidase protein [Apiospora rasikravindrae]|uniref:Carboxypeptidase n=1 Tax=Apiospora rasikravindrae TaxID=990691 RepID=A0ABR1SCT3_9PEZI
MLQFLSRAAAAASLLLWLLLIPHVAAEPLPHPVEQLLRRQLPASPKGVKTITTPNNVTVRYKEPGSEGVCETTPGVKSYSGYVDLDEHTHMFFWFFEARKNPDKAPITLWLNGGPGSDSLISLFSAVGPCNVTSNGTAVLNPYSWTEESNMLFLSQPVGVGFSYQEKIEGNYDNATGVATNSSNPTGRFSGIRDDYSTDRTALAAVTAWEVMQAFFGTLPRLDPTVQSCRFHLWTESYGGHWGPGFYRYFYEQNERIRNGTTGGRGVQLEMESLGIINGLISPRIQYPFWPEFARNNTYGISVDDFTYNIMKLNMEMQGGCKTAIDTCLLADTLPQGATLCAYAHMVCNNLALGPYTALGGRDVYDVRAAANADIPPSRHWMDYVNTARVQDALGVDLNYTDKFSVGVNFAFGLQGDQVRDTTFHDLEWLLAKGVRVALVYGDADFICNWVGGEAVSLSLKWPNATAFATAGYAPFTVASSGSTSNSSNKTYGETRQYGGLSFTRVYEAGHIVPYYQPAAGLELFRRVLRDRVLAGDGDVHVTPTFESHGPANATATNSGWDTGAMFTGRPGDWKKRRGF